MNGNRFVIGASELQNITDLKEIVMHKFIQQTVLSFKDNNLKSNDVTLSSSLKNLIEYRHNNSPHDHLHLTNTLLNAFGKHTNAENSSLSRVTTGVPNINTKGGVLDISPFDK